MSLTTIKCVSCSGLHRIDRINGVYEAEVAVRMVLVANTHLLFYYNPSTDHYTNNNVSTMLGENVTTCNNVIGSANYIVD
jgi:hypothetical protein